MLESLAELTDHLPMSDDIDRKLRRMERLLRADPERYTRPPEPEIPKLAAASHSHQMASSPQIHYTTGSTGTAYTYNSHSHTINSVSDPSISWHFPNP